jgi:DNA invertase Pin-like site-specific DNA recombinase
MHLLELIEARNKVDPTPWKVIRIYEDERFNEGTLSRPGLFLLREAVSRREIDIVVTLGLNRLARSPSHLFIVGRELFENDVQAISLYRDGSGAVEAKNLFPHIKQAVAMMRSPRDKAAAILTAIGE